ncbi:MAG: hypothetical protein WC141_00095 [Arcobacteraceae bacterium]
MIKFILVLSCLLLTQLSAKVLVMGDSANGYKCDNVLKYPTSLEECKNIEALEEVNICYFKNMAMGCKKIFKGESYEVGSTDKSSLNFDRLLSFNNNTKVSFGVKRFGSAPKDTGMPVGTLLKPNENIQIPLDKSYAVKLVILNNNKEVLNRSFEKDVIEISKDIFQYSKNYNWELHLDGVLHKGTFDVLDKPTQEELTQEFKELSKGITDKKAQLFIKSILFDQYGLNYNRNEILKEDN